jgi:hypothetical protein
MTAQQDQPNRPAITLPSVERVQQELASAKNIDNFFGKDGHYICSFGPKRLRRPVKAPNPLACPHAESTRTANRADYGGATLASRVVLRRCRACVPSCCWCCGIVRSERSQPV